MLNNFAVSKAAVEAAAVSAVAPIKKGWGGQVRFYLPISLHCCCSYFTLTATHVGTTKAVPFRGLLQMRQRNGVGNGPAFV